MRILAAIGFLAIVAFIAAAVYFFGGFYSVAGTQPDPKIVTWALNTIRAASVDRHAVLGPPFPLDDPTAVRTGALAFAERGCVNCHGAPGVKWEKFSEGLRPDPPDLKEVVNERQPRQLFWVIANGVNMTGMPSFGLTGVSDLEIWAIVAFLKKLPTVSEADFKAWAAGGAGAARPPG